MTLGEITPAKKGDTYLVANRDIFKKIEVSALIAGGGIAGSSLFRYMAEAGMNPVLVNADRGSSWRNIGGGRTAFSLPELAEIAAQNHHILKNYNICPISITNLSGTSVLHTMRRLIKHWKPAKPGRKRK